MSKTITCPSGLSGRIRGMKVREERILSDRKLVPGWQLICRLIDACWMTTLDPGPYDFGDNGIDWNQVSDEDRIFVLLQIRAQTYGGSEHCVPCHNEVCGYLFAVDEIAESTLEIVCPKCLTVNRPAW